MAKLRQRKRGPRLIQPMDDPARGARIKDAIKARGLTQAAVAQAMDAAVSTVARWCSGQQDPIKQIDKLAELLARSPQYLMFGAELTPALLEFESWLSMTKAGDEAPAHILKSLRGMPLHAPTLNLYKRLFYFLMSEYQVRE